MSVRPALRVTVMQSASISGDIIDVNAKLVGKARAYHQSMDALISTSVQQEETSAMRKRLVLIMMAALNARVLNRTGPTLKVGNSHVRDKTSFFKEMVIFVRRS